MIQKTALVVGATGLIGRHLVNALIDSKTFNKVITLTRKSLIIDSEKFENYVVDFEYLDDVAELFTADILFSCLGTTKKQAGSIAAQRKIDFDYQLHAAQLAYQQGVQEYFLVSSSAANEHSPSAYLKMKGQLEKKVLELGFSRCVIFRPSLLLGKRAEPRFSEDFAAKVMPLLRYIPLLKKYRPINGEQVAAKMVIIAEQQRWGKERYSLEQIFRIDP